jgi:hypothetical protein
MFWKSIHRQSTIYLKSDLAATSENASGIETIAQKVRARIFCPVKSDGGEEMGIRLFIVQPDRMIGLNLSEFDATISSFHTSCQDPMAKISEIIGILDQSNSRVTLFTC